MPQSRVRFIGSRELHRDLPKVLDTLENPDARFVLTIHSKPKAVLIGAEAFLDILRGPAPKTVCWPCSSAPSSRGSNRRTLPPKPTSRKKSWSESEPIAAHPSVRATIPLSCQQRPSILARCSLVPRDRPGTRSFTPAAVQSSPLECAISAPKFRIVALVAVATSILRRIGDRRCRARVGAVTVSGSNRAVVTPLRARSSAGYGRLRPVAGSRVCAWIATGTSESSRIRRERLDGAGRAPVLPQRE